MISLIYKAYFSVARVDYSRSHFSPAAAPLPLSHAVVGSIEARAGGPTTTSSRLALLDGLSRAGRSQGCTLFGWVPADGGRHATADVRLAGAYATGETIVALCARKVTVAKSTEVAWLWPTCVECNSEAYALAESGAER